ncbi:MAG: type II toxin-antitoxin system VapC family toxin [Candidatus Heimdallarchaeota archaeon]|nr:MAG: type II toxin-antitoxin system VapC family toxin [Candidatus Heimdallarchaeota archaeon]
MGVYLDTNIFYNAYCPVENNALADWILNQLTPKFQGVTCEWTILEMFLALKKQVNLEKIEEKAAKIALDFFLSELGEMAEEEVLKIIPVTRSAIMVSRKQIFDHNLYAADALHAAIALASQVTLFITFDSDFRGNLGIVPILNPNDPDFKEKFLTRL